MDKMNRRRFIKTASSGLAAASLLPAWKLSATSGTGHFLGPVLLGNTGIEVTRVALGMGTNGFRKSSAQKRLGVNTFLDLAQHAYDKGIRFFETADTYGTHEYLNETLKHIPREKLTIMTKMWTRVQDIAAKEDAHTAFDRFRTEIGVDKIDILLLHCQVAEDWDDQYKQIRDDLSELKVQGKIGALGVSCHSWEAMETAAKSDWVDVILARVNDNGARMDNSPDKVMELLKGMHDKGKGVIGMKIFGGGSTVEEHQRQSALEYVLKSGNVDTITLGFNKIEHVDDALRRVKGIVKS